MKAEDKIRFQHMLDAAEKAVQITSGVSFDEFIEDEVLSNAIVRLLSVIGEAASRVNKSTQSVYPQIEWPIIVGMRNKLIHAYFNIDYEIVWETLTHNLPSFIVEIKMILKLTEEN